MGLLAFLYLCLWLCDSLCQCVCLCVCLLVSVWVRVCVCVCVGVCWFCLHVWLPLRVGPRGTPHSHLKGQRWCTVKEMGGSVDATPCLAGVQGNWRAWAAAVLRRQPRLMIGNKEYASQDLRGIRDVDWRRLAGFKTRTLGNRGTL